MAFIDIFNFKKYITKQSDAQVARYGHINALAGATLDAVKNNVYPDNAAALAGGLLPGDLYSADGTGTVAEGVVMVVVPAP